MGTLRKWGRKFDKAVLQPIGNTIEAILEDPKKLAMVAISVFAPGVGTAIGSAMGLSGTAATIIGNAAVNTALNGGDVKSAIIAAAIPVVGRELAGTAASAFVDAGMDKALAQTAGNVVAGAGISAAQGKDPLEALISGGISAGTAAITRDLPGFSDLPEAAQRTINAAVAAELSGGDASQAAINTAINAGLAAVKASGSQLGSGIKDLAPVEDLIAEQPEQTKGVASIDIPATQDQEPEGIAALQAEPGFSTVQQNDDGSVTHTFADGSQITETGTGDLVEQKTPTQVEFESSAETEKPVDWAALYATPTTDPTTGKTIVGGDVSKYAVQDFGGADALKNWDEYQTALQDIVDNGGYSTMWKPNEDGTKTYTSDDGSTMTVDADNNIIGVTNATDTPYKPPSTAKTGSTGSGGVNLGYIPALIGGAALINAADDGDVAAQEQPRQFLSMDWNQQDVNPVEGGIAYGQKFFDPVFTETDKVAAAGGLMSLAKGGMTMSHLGGYSDGGRLLRGPGDGMSDHIPASIGGRQPARLADGEFVVPADVVSHLGNGSTEAGSRVLYDMMDRVRKARTGTKKQGKQINPKKFIPR